MRSTLLSLWLLSALAVLQGQDAPPKVISPTAATYVEAALKIMQAHFLHKERIDWLKLKEETLAQAAGAQTAVDTYPAIRFALAKLGDHHSYLQLTPGLSSQETARQPKLTDPASMPVRPSRKPTSPFPSPFRTRRVPEGAMLAGSACPIAQVVIPLFGNQEQKDIDDYATNVQRVIAGLVPKNPRGWIVDLRGNGGGNMWAMMAGVGPILGAGEPGASLQEDGTKGIWYYEDGKAGWRNDTKDPYYARAAAAPVHLANVPPVAVLIDRETASSGEGIAIAFRGRQDTRFFGESTYGAATSTFPFRLSDGAQLFLVTGVMVDKRGNEYTDGLVPDQEILSEATISTNDPVIRAASEWLTERAGCPSKGGK
jgi:carboxyl-terminal processing protease